MTREPCHCYQFATGLPDGKRVAIVGGLGDGNSHDGEPWRRHFLLGKMALPSLKFLPLNLVSGLGLPVGNGKMAEAL